MALGGSFLVRCTSSDRVSGTLSSFIVDVSSNQQLQNVCCMRVHTVSFPNTQTNITDYNNQLLIQPFAGAETLITMPAGQYTADDWAAAVTAAVLAAFPGSGFLCVLDDPDFNPRFHFTSVTPFQYFSEYDNGGISGASRTLGISEGSQAFVTNFVAQSVPNLRGLTVVSLQSQTLAMSRAVQARDDQNNEPSIALSVVTEIPINVEWLGWQSYRPILDQTVRYSAPVTISQIAFTLRDPLSGGRLVDLAEPGLHVMIEVET